MRKVWLSEAHLLSEDGSVENTETGKVLKQSKTPAGYFTYSSNLGGSVHRLLAHNFLGGIPEGLVVNHIDGDKENNLLSNLEITTHQENTIHAYKTGLAQGKKGEDNSQAILNDEDILRMFTMFREGANNLEVSKVFGVHDRYVSLVRHGKRWGHLSKGEKFPKSFNFKYPKEDILHAYDLVQAGYRNMDIEEITGIERSMISRIRTGKAYPEFFQIHRGCND